MVIAKIKFFLQKRLPSFNSIKWDAKSIYKGNRKLKHVIGEPIDVCGKSHVHIYPRLQCNMDCYFCQNKFYVEQLPRYKQAGFEEWVTWLNRMYNFHHIDINGGEPMFYPGIVGLLNNLKHHNIVMFTNMPKERLHLFQEIKNKTCNITMNISYHPLEEKRDIREFVEDFKTIPKRLKPTVHVIDIPEVSYKNVRAAFAARGVYIEGLSAIVPTGQNKIKEPFKTVMCRSDMDAIAPDLQVYHCTGLMLREIGGVHISEYQFTNKHIKCDYYGLCGPCTTMKDVVDVDSKII